jgi:peptide/nickel transport system permease protein
VSAYLVRRLLYAIPVLLMVNVITFSLFFMVNSPDDMARAQLGIKRISQERIDQWKQERGYDLPLFFNPAAGGLASFSQTVFFQKSLRLFVFDFGKSDEGRLIARDIRDRMGPSLAVALPTFFIGLTVTITLALMVVMFRASIFELTAMILCVAMFSISGIFYIIGGQFLFGKLWALVPISGYLHGVEAIKFVILPVLIGIVSGIGGGVRLYRMIFLEEVNKDYIRTARAKGLSEMQILFRHLLPNGMLPILTLVVAVIPSLFTGSLLIENFFGIPGLGSYVIDGIRAQDFSIVRSMVFLGTVLYILGLILTDISYALADPRVRLK